jgi:hypothetical protein
MNAHTPNDTTDDRRDTRRRWTTSIVIASIAIVAVVIAAIAIALNVAQGDVSAGGEPDAVVPTASPPAPTTSPSATSEGEWACPPATVEASTSDELYSALDDAEPGDIIQLAPGRYAGEFIATVDGTADAPIMLCGTPESVLDGEGIKGGYVFHLDGATNWVLHGFAVENGQKGVMADGTTGSSIRNLTVSKIGDEAIHLRSGSSDNQVLYNTISETGLRKPKFGEGIYIGTAESNWCETNNCEPDASDRNLIEGNNISNTTSESVDIKEGTTGGILRGNTFDGSGLVEADSWVDVKGNDWVIEGNTGTASAEDGYQTHEILDGWGTRNVFTKNVAELTGSGLGFSLEPERENVLRCDNSVRGSEAQLSNVDCRD